MTIPTLRDWGEIDKDDLDAQGALKQFLGKSFLDAEALFAENALYYGEDLQSMPTAVFNFYAPALARYLTSDKSRGDCDGASRVSVGRLYAWKLLQGCHLQNALDSIGSPRPWAPVLRHVRKQFTLQ
jgi:hypothetical protein